MGLAHAYHLCFFNAPELEPGTVIFFVHVGVSCFAADQLGFFGTKDGSCFDTGGIADDIQKRSKSFWNTDLPAGRQVTQGNTDKKL